MIGLCEFALSSRQSGFRVDRSGAEKRKMKTINLVWWMVLDCGLIESRGGEEVSMNSG